MYVCIYVRMYMCLFTYGSHVCMHESTFVCVRCVNVWVCVYT